MWIGLATGACLFFFDRALEEYAGGIAAIVGAQIPAYLALAAAKPGQPLGRAPAIALGVPAAIVGALGPLFVLTVVGMTAWPPVPFELRPYLLGLAAYAIALVVGLVTYLRWLRRGGFPHAARRVMARVCLAGVLGAIAVATRWSEAARDPVIWLAVLAPSLWTIPLWWLLRAPPSLPDARVRRAS